MPDTSSSIGVYPGTFDPVTNGHMDIITRARRTLDHVIVAIAENEEKTPLFSIEERIALTRSEIQNTAVQNISIGGRPLGSVEVVAFDALLVDFVRAQGASVIVRGLRAVSDFEYEFQMAAMNACMAEDIETIFLMASEKCQFISSRFVKEIARMGGDVSRFVSSRVADSLVKRLR